MRKFIVTLFVLILLCLASCSCTSLNDWADFTEDHVVLTKNISTNGYTCYFLGAPNNRYFNLYARDDFANVGDIIRYENKSIIAVKKEIPKKE